MIDRRLRPRVVCVGKAASERVSEKRAELHEWVADILTGRLCQPDQYDTTVYLGLEELLSGADDLPIREVLSKTLPQKDENDAVVLIDLTANPYDLLPDPLLASVGEFVSDWCRGTSRLSIVLIPVMPPRESSILWPSIGEALEAGSVLIVANDGTVLGNVPPSSSNVGPIEGYSDRQAELAGSYDSRIPRNILRRLGHFPVQGDGTSDCARYFFDCSLAVDDIAHAIARYIDRRIRPVHPNFTLLTHGPRSAWLTEVGMNAALLLNASWQDASNTETLVPSLAEGSVGVLIFDVVNSGRTLRRVLQRLRESNMSLAPRGMAVLMDRDAPALEATDDFSLKRLAVVDTSKVSSDSCIQCSLGLPFTDPRRDSHMSLRSYDAWEIFLESKWLEEPYGPTGLHLFDEAPDLGYAIENYGDYLAYKVELIVESLNPSADLIFVHPDEPRVRALVDRLGPRFQDRFVAVRIPRASLEQPPGMQDGQDRAAWCKQLSHLKANSAATVIVIDEMNASSTTASSLIRLLAARMLKPKAYIPILNLDDVEEVSGVPVLPVYSIPSPREIPR